MKVGACNQLKARVTAIKRGEVMAHFSVLTSSPAASRGCSGTSRADQSGRPPQD